MNLYLGSRCCERELVTDFDDAPKFKLDNITGGTWKPHLYDKDLFERMFKRDNITGGTWKPHFFVRA